MRGLLFLTLFATLSGCSGKVCMPPDTQYPSSDVHAVTVTLKNGDIQNWAVHWAYELKFKNVNHDGDDSCSAVIDIELTRFVTNAPKANPVVWSKEEVRQQEIKYFNQGECGDICSDVRPHNLERKAHYQTKVDQLHRDQTEIDATSKFILSRFQGCASGMSASTCPVKTITIQ